MEEFPDNSDKSKDEKEASESAETEKVIVGTAKQRKKPLSKRFREVFIEDDAQSVVGYVMMDVLVPAARDMIIDAGTSFLEQTFGGQAGSRTRRRGGRSDAGRVNYGGFSAPPRQDPRIREREERRYARPVRDTHGIDDVVLQTRAEADLVLDNLYMKLEKYDQVTVSDLLSSVGITPAFTDDRWGWTSLSGSSIRRLGREGYVLNLPRVESLD